MDATSECTHKHTCTYIYIDTLSEYIYVHMYVNKCAYQLYIRKVVHGQSVQGPTMGLSIGCNSPRFSLPTFRVFFFVGLCTVMTWGMVGSTAAGYRVATCPC